ncbi:acyltransferase [Methylobacterium sp. WL18]|uniref:acyltransferase family protein n=1 Tax=Methylobacterium sp. WL18 TaxID=2603897 RepID=UPI0011C9E45B|nr:acyltransferase [Methylobacterium sp. WL18]TXN71216.1 acyltransferase [Methylobacterium sp. WL18]
MSKFRMPPVADGPLETIQPNYQERVKSRVFALDGLRGWASLSVVCFHILWETFGEIYPDIRNNITAFLLDGSLAVSVFFVLSGEALSASYFSGRGLKSVFDLMIKRYPRLVFPVLSAAVITAVIVAFGLNHNVEAGLIVGRTDWLGSWLNFRPSIIGTLRFSFYDVFLNVNPTQSLVPFLWTMRIEFIGSCLVFALLILCNGERFKWWIVHLTFFILIVSHLYLKNVSLGNLACFISGVYCSKLRCIGLFEKYKVSLSALIISSSTIVLLLTFDSLMHAGGTLELRTPFFAMILVAAISFNRFAERFLSNKLSQFLGKISFPLFLIQFPILISYTSWLIVYSSDENRFTGSVTAVFLSSLSICVVASVLFMPVEAATKSICNFILQSTRRTGKAIYLSMSDKKLVDKKLNKTST